MHFIAWIPARRRERKPSASSGHAEDVCADCAEILHGLNNALAGMLLNAQVMEWKLPSYSRSRRYLHEIERNAQRGGELVKRLLERLEARCPAAVSECRSSAGTSASAAEDCALATPERGAADLVSELSLKVANHPTSVFLSHPENAPHTMV